MSTTGPEAVINNFLKAVIKGEIEGTQKTHSALMEHFKPSLNNENETLKAVLAEALKWAAANGWLWIVKFLLFQHTEKTIPHEVRAQALQKAITYQRINVKKFLLGKTHLQETEVYQNPDFWGGADKGSFTILGYPGESNHFRFHSSVFTPNFQHIISEIQSLDLQTQPSSTLASQAESSSELNARAGTFEHQKKRK